MTGPLILIAAIIIVFVIAFVVTMLFVNAQTSKIIDVNVKLAESQHTLLSQNKTQTDLLEKLEEQAASQHRELDIQQRELQELHKRTEGLDSSQSQWSVRFHPMHQWRPVAGCLQDEAHECCLDEPAGQSAVDMVNAESGFLDFYRVGNNVVSFLILHINYIGMQIKK